MHTPAPSRRQIWLLIVSIVAASAACGVGWQQNWISQRQAYLKIDGVLDQSQCCGHKAADRPVAPALLWLFGERGVRLLLVYGTSNADFSQARSLFPEAMCEQTAVFGGVNVAR